MQNVLIYLLEVSVLTSIFYLFYRYLYFKLAYFEWSRYYFYAFLIISLTIPILPGLFEQNEMFIKLESVFGYNEFDGAGKLNYINVKDSFLHQNESILSDIPFVKILFIVWISGFVRYVFIITKSIISVLRIKHLSAVKKEGKYRIISADINDNAFTFFRQIFVNADFSRLSENEQKQILH